MSLRTLPCVATIGCALALSACQAVKTDVAKLDPAAPATIGKVQSAAIKACGFEPTAATVTKIVGTITGYSMFADPAADIADRICAAVTTKSAVVAALDGAPVAAWAQSSSGGSVNDVPVKGRFVKRKGG